MQLKFFHIPAVDATTAEDELNRFLRSHRVLDVKTKFSDSGGPPTWNVCVRWLETGSGAAVGGKSRAKKAKVDYKEMLDEPTFAVFSKLRECRKEIAQEEGLPAFAVFTDEELAGIAKLEGRTEKTIQGINGIGEKKAARFGAKLLQEYDARTTNEASG